MDLLRDLLTLWEAAQPEERNRLARTVFAAVAVENGRIEAVVPQPELEPLFLALDMTTPGGEAGERQGSASGYGSDGVPLSTIQHCQPSSTGRNAVSRTASLKPTGRRPSPAPSTREHGA